MTTKQWEKIVGKLEGMLVKGEPHFHFLQLTLKCGDHYDCHIKHYWNSREAALGSGSFCHRLHKKKPLPRTANAKKKQLKDYLGRVL